MTPLQWRQIEELYDAVLQRPAGERADFLAQADPELRRQVEILLAQPNSGSPLDRPAWEGMSPADEQAQPDVWPAGSKIGNFEIISLLGRGGMGEVYRARDSRLKREVAIKFLHPDLSGDKPRRRRLLQEARSASALNHPGIVTVHEIGESGGREFMVMELVNGQPLSQLIGPKGLPVRDALQDAIAIANAVAAAHSHGVLHRDLKPGNIMVAPNGSLKVLDFGLAKLLHPDPTDTAETRSLRSETEEGSILGTAAYMSPEQAEGKPVDARSDIFSFGIVLYEMLTGRRPFSGGSRMSTIAAILQQDPKPPRTLEAKIPIELERVVLRCLCKDPDQRFQTMTDLELSLEEVREKSDSGKAAAVPAPPPSRRRWMIAAVTLACLAIGAALTVWMVRPRAVAKQQRVLTRLTADGVSSVRDISPDGKIMAYFRFDEPGKPSNVWVRQVFGGTPHPVTDEPGGITAFRFSPDGTHAVYSRAKDDRIYEIPAFGGEARLLGGDGKVTAYFPDGLALVVQKTDKITGNSEWYSLPVRGGEHKSLMAGLQADYFALSPDGTHLMAWAYHPETSETDLKHWSLISLGDGSVRETTAPVIMNSQTEAPAPRWWVKDPEELRRQWIIYAAWSADGHNIFRSLVDDHGRVGPEVERLTLTSGVFFEPVVSANGILLFNRLDGARNLWKVPIDASTGKTRGERERVTRDEGVSYNGVSMSQDGRRLTYFKGDGQVYSRELPTGRETKLAEGDMPTISPDGSLVAFQKYEAGKGDIYLVQSTGGTPLKVTLSSVNVIGLQGISTNNRYLLYQEEGAPHPNRIARISLQTGEIQRVLSHPTHPVYHAHFSPDQHWMTFKMELESDRHQIFITPVKDYMPAGEERWLPLTDGRYWDDKPALSPDGRMLYFTSNRDGYDCIWVQKLDPTTKHPLGAPTAIQHFHSERQFPLVDNPLISMELFVAKDMLITSPNDVHTDVWMIDLSSRR